MRQYLLGLLPYYRHVLGTIVIGSLCGLVMNTTVVLPPILLGRAIDTMNALAAGEATTAAVGLAALAHLGGVLLVESARAVTRWCLERAILGMRTTMQADAFRGVLACPTLHAARSESGWSTSRCAIPARRRRPLLPWTASPLRYPRESLVSVTGPVGSYDRTPIGDAISRCTAHWWRSKSPDWIGSVRSPPEMQSTSVRRAPCT